MLRGKLGRKPYVPVPSYEAKAPLVAAQLARLGAPPSASVDRFTAVKQWFMFKNDELGDCVPADTAHDLIFRTTVAGAPVIPTDYDVLKLYAMFGYDPLRPAETDQGVSEIAMGIVLTVEGFMGHRADNCVPIDFKDLNAVRWAIEWFGSCRLGVDLPESAGLQFEANQPWTVVANSKIEGPHDIRAFNYRDQWFDCVTWGGIVQVHEDWMNAYLAEAHAELFYDWIQKNGASPGGFTIAALASDLNSLPKEAIT